MNHAGRQSASGWTRLGLLLVLISGAALRFIYGAYEPSLDRFWDERYALMNVRSIIEDQTLEPAKSYYPSPVFNLPAAALVVAADQAGESLGRESSEVYEASRFGPGAFVLLRWLQAAFGMLAVFLSYRVGRRMVSPAAGWMMAALIAFAPWGVHSSGYFKPDALSMAMVLLAFDWSLSALRRPTVGRFALAGVGIALAMSAKLTGSLIAMALVVGCFWPGSQQRQRLQGLVLAGVSTLVAFFAMNPYGRYYLQFLSGLKEDYKLRTDVAQGDWLSVVSRALEFPLDRAAFGPVLGFLVIAGFLVWCGSLVFGKLDPAVARERAAAMIYPPVFAITYALQTPYFKSNNFLPALPFLTLGFAWSAWSLWSRVQERRPRLSWLGPVLGVCFLLASSRPGFVYVYESLVPMTIDQALLDLERPLRPKKGRVVWVDDEVYDSWLEWEGRARVPLDGLVAVERTASIRELPEDLFVSADAFVFASRRLEEPFYREMTEMPAARVLEVAAERRSLRGPELTIVESGWRLIKPAVAVSAASCDDAGACWRLAPASPIEPGSLVSVSLEMVGRQAKRLAPRFFVSDREVRFSLASTVLPSGVLWVSDRFEWQAPAETSATARANEPNMMLDLGQRLRPHQTPQVEIRRWRKRGQPASGAPSPSSM